MLYLLPTLTLLLGLALGFATARYLAKQTQTSLDPTAQLRDAFDALAAKALAANTEQFLALAGEKLGQQREQTEQTLDTKQQLIDQRLAHMNEVLGKVTETLVATDKQRHASFATLSDQLARSHQNIDALRQTTADLKSTLSNARVRGQWGERMAEDVLRLAGFVEGTNYTKQVQLQGEGGGKPRPDFTFRLPQNRVVHMDVKFPLDQYLKYVEATDDPTRDAAKAAFLRAARERVKETTKRSYATLTAAESESTLDYTLVFIPNEQVYAFLMEHDRDILDAALSSKVILCSPTTLFAILSVIRQAMDNFQMQSNMHHALKILTGFGDQWRLFSKEFTALRDRFESVAKGFTHIETTRYNVMERQLGKLENLKLPDPGTGAELIDFPDQRKAG